MTFRNLHEQDTPLLLGNVWDVPSAQIAEALHFQAIGTSSAAIARLLGYKDGEEIQFSELEYVVKRIAANTSLPLSVDLEAGYSSDPEAIVNHIRRLADLGVVGINIEDSHVAPNRQLLKAEIFASTLSKISTVIEKEGLDIFLNVRTDTFLLNIPNTLEETLNRIHLYEIAGADGIFTPGIVKASEIAVIVESTNLPINVMCMPDLPDFKILKSLGVKRISMGNFLFDRMYDHLEHITSQVIDQNSFESVF